MASSTPMQCTCSRCSSRVPTAPDNEEESEELVLGAREESVVRREVVLVALVVGGLDSSRRDQDRRPVMATRCTSHTR